MRLAVHVDRTPSRASGSSAHAPKLSAANHDTMFSNRIGFGPRLGAALLDIVFIIILLVPISLLGDKRQALQDIIGKTAVYKKSDIAG